MAIHDPVSQQQDLDAVGLGKVRNYVTSAGGVPYSSQVMSTQASVAHVQALRKHSSGAPPSNIYWGCGALASPERLVLLLARIPKYFGTRAKGTSVHPR